MTNSVHSEVPSPTYVYHRFLDEAGDTTFFGKGRTPIIGTTGVSNYFLLGMLSIHEPLDEVRLRVKKLHHDILSDPYLKPVASIQKKINKRGYYLHAKDDVPEVRKMVFELIVSVKCHFDAVICKKEYHVYAKKHNENQSEFYADMLSHLLQNSMTTHAKIVLNIAHRNRCTTHNNLQKGLDKAFLIAKNKSAARLRLVDAHFNIQYPTTEPIINLADYFLWALQRMVERGETRYYDFLKGQMNNIINLQSNEDFDNIIK